MGKYDLFSMLVGLGFGLILAIAAWFVAKIRFSNLGISEKELKDRYILKDIYESLLQQTDFLQDNLQDKEMEIRSLGQQIASQKQAIQHLDENLRKERLHIESLQSKFETQFENIANRLLEEKSNRFAKQNEKQIGDILSPLKEKIMSFEASIEKKFLEETKDRISLKNQIEHLSSLNQQLSKDAGNLVSALKGDSKTQGDWGEFQLETLLTRAGLEKGIHFMAQNSFKDDHGLDKRPDFIINLPDGKHLVIDSKVSLSAFERYFNTEDKAEKAKHLSNHILSVKKHIKDLASKNYQNLYQINSPDYLLMFFPVESAFRAAISENGHLYEEALEKNIVLVTTSTLLATLRTVAYIWTQDKQKNNVLEIARQSGMLYDKFVNFVEDLRLIGSRLDSTQNVYHQAMNKLVDSKKFGDTLIGRAEKIKQLGAKTSKALPKGMVEVSDQL